jgi:RNase P subunit RPR2
VRKVFHIFAGTKPSTTLKCSFLGCNLTAYSLCTNCFEPLYIFHAVEDERAASYGLLLIPICLTCDEKKRESEQSTEEDDPYLRFEDSNDTSEEEQK